MSDSFSAVSPSFLAIADGCLGLDWRTESNTSFSDTFLADLLAFET